MLSTLQELSHSVITVYLWTMLLLSLFSGWQNQGLLRKTFVKGHTRYKELNSKPGLCFPWTGLELMSIGPAWAERGGQGRQSTFLACWVSGRWGWVDLWLEKWVGAQFSLSGILMSVSWNVTLYRSLSWWMDKEDEVHLHNGVLLSHKKEWNRNCPGDPVVDSASQYRVCVFKLWLGSHMPRGQKTKTINQKQYCKKFSKEFKNGPCQKISWKKKEWNNSTCNNVVEPRDYHTKWGKSEGERQIPYDITYM